MSRAYYKRLFLNSEEHGGVAFVEASVYEGGTSGVNADFTIADCSRQINLDFSAYSEEQAENVLLKLRRLRTTLAAFDTAVRAQLDGMAWKK